MHQPIRTRQLCLALALGVSVLAAPGCGDDEPPVPPPIPPPVVPGQPVPPPAVPPATPGAPATPPGAAGTPNANLDENEQAASSDGIEARVRSLQLFHAEARRRPMPPLVQDTRDDQDWIQTGGFQVAMQVEAVNTTNRLLYMPTFDSSIRVQGQQGGRRCVPARDRDGHVTLGRRVSDGPGNVWRIDDGEEYYWRPGERVRFTMRARCGPIALLEVRPQTIAGAFQIIAGSAFEMGPRIRVDVPVSLPGSAMHITQIALPDGSTGYAVGNIVTHADANGAVQRDHMATWGISANTAQRTDLPAATPPLNVTQNEWTLTVPANGITIQHYTQSDVHKGKRLVRIQASININTGGIEARLQGDVNTAQQALAAAQSTLGTAQGALSTAQGSGDEAAIDAAEDQVRDAERAVSSAERALSSAERSFSRGLSSERSGMARLLSCDRMQLATHRANRNARNARDARSSCQALSDAGQATVVWEFEIDRYEIPVGLSFRLGRDPRFVPIASAPLATFDIH